MLNKVHYFQEGKSIRKHISKLFKKKKKKVSNNGPTNLLFKIFGKKILKFFLDEPILI